MLAPWKESYDTPSQCIKKQTHHFADVKSKLSRLWSLQWSCMDVRIGSQRRLSTEELMLLNCGVREDF